MLQGQIDLLLGELEIGRVGLALGLRGLRRRGVLESFAWLPPAGSPEPCWPACWEDWAPGLAAAGLVLAFGRSSAWNRLAAFASRRLAVCSSADWCFSPLALALFLVRRIGADPLERTASPAFLPVASSPCSLETAPRCRPPSACRRLPCRSSCPVDRRRPRRRLCDRLGFRWWNSNRAGYCRATGNCRTSDSGLRGRRRTSARRDRDRPGSRGAAAILRRRIAGLAGIFLARFAVRCAALVAAGLAAVGLLAAAAGALLVALAGLGLLIAAGLSAAARLFFRLGFRILAAALGIAVLVLGLFPGFFPPGRFSPPEPLLPDGFFSAVFGPLWAG